MLNIIINGQGPEPPDTVYLSGGTIRLIEIMKRISREKGVNLYVISSKGVCNTFMKNGINANYKVSPFFLKRTSSYFSSFLDSVFRTIRVSLSSLPTEKGILYSPSDFLWDAFPAFVWKLRKRKMKWITCIFLVVPNLFRDYTQSFDKNNRLSVPTPRRLLYFLSQQFTISWGKRWADQMLVLNKMDKEYLVYNKGVDESKVSVVNGGVDYDHINSLKTDVKLYDGVFLGRFHPQKGIFDLIRIWKLICEKKPNAKLCIIGSGSASITEKVTAAITENSLSDNVVLAGSQTGDEKFLLLKSSGIFLCPSHYESFAIVIAEAMACGLPVVAYDLPIYKDLYGENISKVPLGDLKQFADAIMNFLTNDELRRIFGLAGQKFIERYDWDKVAKQEILLIEGLQK
jgi:glycosyltransferase involved in cell wall biosynthesis